MKESYLRAILELIGVLIGRLFGLYLASIVIFFFYFNYFANSPTHPFSEINAAGKAIVWPYILFFKKKDAAIQEKSQAAISVPKSVELFMRSIQPLNRFGAMLKEYRGHPENPALEKSEIEKLEILLQSSIDSVESIDRGELNGIYPEWGDHVENDLRAGLKLMKEGGETSNKTKYFDGYAKLESWGNWAQKHEKTIQDVLREKYNYVPTSQP